MGIVAPVLVGTLAAVIAGFAMAAHDLGWSELKAQFRRNNHNHKMRNKKAAPYEKR